MNLEEIKQQAQNLKQVDPSTLSLEQLYELVNKLASMVDTTEQQLSNIKIETNEK
jgi:translation initiation factor 2B subunit (eIF-2B alpha/beta/delta family)